MRRLVYLSVALTTFGVGLFVWFANPLGWVHRDSEPLRVTLSSTTVPADKSASFEHYIVTVENRSKETVRGYSVAFTCKWGVYSDSGGWGRTFFNPSPERQELRPGESQTIPVYADMLPANEEERMVWVDLVHFKGGGNWGANQGHTEGYVRE